MPVLLELGKFPKDLTLDIPSTITAALERLTEIVMPLPGVVGTAIGEAGGEPCIKVFVERRDDDLNRRIPTEFEGYKVILQVTGVIRKRNPL